MATAAVDMTGIIIECRGGTLNLVSVGNILLCIVGGFDNYHFDYLY